VAGPTPFAEHRYVGDKRTQVVHDREHAVEDCQLDELAASERYAMFGPDSLPEARNRGYRAHRACQPPEPDGQPPAPDAS
jgi:hypothetical protein